MKRRFWQCRDCNTWTWWETVLFWLAYPFLIVINKAKKIWRVLF